MAMKIVPLLEIISYENFYIICNNKKSVSNVAKDLKVGLNLTNELFKDKNFPSVNI